MSYLIQVNSHKLVNRFRSRVIGHVQYLTVFSKHKQIISLLLILCSGVAVGNEFCNTSESPPLRDPTLWTFSMGWFVKTDLAAHNSAHSQYLYKVITSYVDLPATEIVRILLSS